MEAMSKATPKLPRIAIRTALDGRGLVEVVVEDGGRGMAPDVLDHAFDSFFTTKPQGMGLGLALSRSMVEAHGRPLWATSQEGSEERRVGKECVSPRRSRWWPHP